VDAIDAMLRDLHTGEAFTSVARVVTGQAHTPM